MFVMRWRFLSQVQYLMLLKSAQTSPADHRVRQAANTSYWQENADSIAGTGMPSLSMRAVVK